MENAKITFKNGTEITAEVNGGSFIVAEKPQFPSDLSVVTIEDGNGERTIGHAQIVECAGCGDGYWFTIIGTPADTVAMEKMQADIDFIAMEMDIEL